MTHYQIKKSITDRSLISVNIYLKQISKYPLLSDEQEKKIACQAREGDKDARLLLINSNLRFVISIAKQYQGKGLDLSDLIEYGNLGLIKAAEKFDETRGFKFISYAVWWIRQSILLALASTSKTIRIPLNKLNLMSQINKFSAKFEQKNERLPTTSEIADYFLFPEETISEILQNNTSTISLDTPVGDDSFEQISDIIPEEEIINQEEKKEEIINKIRESIQRLNPIEQLVLKQCFGIQTPIQTIDTIAENLNVTKERVRQIRDYAIIKLRKIEPELNLSQYLG